MDGVSIIFFCLFLFTLAIICMAIFSPKENKRVDGTLNEQPNIETEEAKTGKISSAIEKRNAEKSVNKKMVAFQKIEKLKAYYDRGVITQEEYEKARKEIMDTIE